MRVHHAEEIEASAADVWGLTINVESLPSVTPTVTSVERLDDGPLDVGSQVSIKQPGQRARVWTVTELEPGRRFEWSTTVMGMTMTGTHDVEHTEGVTTNTLSLDLTGTLAPLLGRAFARPFRRALAAENAGFKQAAERVSS